MSAEPVLSSGRLEPGLAPDLNRRRVLAAFLVHFAGVFGFVLGGFEVQALFAAGARPGDPAAILTAMLATAILGRVPVGLLTDWYGERMMAQAVTTAVFLGGATFAVAQDLPPGGLYLGAFLLGLGGAAFPAAVGLLRPALADGHHPTLIGILLFAEAATIAAAVLVPVAGLQTAEDPFMLPVAALAAAALVAIGATPRTPGRMAGQPFSFRAAVDPALAPRAATLMALIALPVGSAVGLAGALVPLFHDSFALDPAIARVWAGTCLFMGFAGALAAGLFAAQLGPRQVVSTAFGIATLGMAVTWAGSAASPNLMFLGFLAVFGGLGAGKSLALSCLSAAHLPRLATLTGTALSLGGAGGLALAWLLDAAWEGGGRFTEMFVLITLLLAGVFGVALAYVLRRPEEWDVLVPPSPEPPLQDPTNRLEEENESHADVPTP